MLANKAEGELYPLKEEWTLRRIEAALDSGAVDHMIDAEDLAHTYT